MRFKLLSLIVLNFLFVLNLSAQCNSNEFTLKMLDDYGDGWTGNTLSIYTLDAACGKALFDGPFTLRSGTTQLESLCLPDGCYSIEMTEDVFSHEISWEIYATGTNNMLAEGEMIEDLMTVTVGIGNCDFVGCTDPTASNYDPAASCTMGSCVYPFPINDDPCSAIHMECGNTEYGITTGATSSGPNSCKGTAVNDMWYTVEGTGETMKFGVQGVQTNSDMQITVLRSFSGDCSLPLFCNSQTSYTADGVNRKVATWSSIEGEMYYINIGSAIDMPDSGFNLDTQCLGCKEPKDFTADHVSNRRALLTWINRSTEMTGQNIWVCPDGAAFGSPPCVQQVSVTSPYDMTDLLACNDLDIYLEQKCDGSTPTLTGPVDVNTMDYAYVAEPNPGEMVCYPPCHNGAETYNTNEEITWLMCADAGTKPSIEFHYVDIEGTVDCSADQIEMFGEGYSGTLCGEMNGNAGSGLAAGQCFYSSSDGGCITVVFKSNSNVEMTGVCFEFGMIPVGDDTNCLDFAESTVPLNLVSFEAKEKGSVNEISWVINSVVNNEWQIIERSNDGVEWTEIDRVEGSNQEAENQRSITDSRPLELSYYRLRTIDFDGAEEVFAPVSVRRSTNPKNTFAISALTPNPANTSVGVSFEGQQDEMTLSVVDFTGKVIWTQVYSELGIENQIDINLTDFPSGVYFVNARSNDQSDVLKLIVNH